LSRKTGILFDKFEILECLKKDSVTTVFVANHVFLAKKILLKTLNKINLQDPVWLERFKREAKILARLDHPNVIRVLDFGSYRDDFYISFEFFESRNLRDVLKQERLTLNEKLNLFRQLTEGLAAAHRLGIVHRDIKPENILVNAARQLKIADFGLAISTEENLLTAKSSVVGTPAYMSPEQIRGERLTPGSDLFSLGIVAFEMFCGYNPFLGTDINATINKILDPEQDELGPVIERDASGLADVIKALLRFRDTTLPASADELSEEGGKTGAAAWPATEGARRKLLYISGAAAAVLLIAVFLFFHTPGNGSENLSGEDTAIYRMMPASPDTISRQISTPPEPGKNPILSSRISATRSIPAAGTGFLYARTEPAAEISVDGQSRGLVSRAAIFDLPVGQHLLSIRSAGFPEYEKLVRIGPGDTLRIEVRLDTLFGFYTCEAYPWGTVYLAGRYQGDTPILKPVQSPPGRYAIVVENPEFPLYHDSITISRNETTRVRINLENMKP